MNRRAVLVLLLATSLSWVPADERSTSVDFVVLVDTSLSMANAIDAVKQYAAGDIVGRLVLPGDWITIMRFYGESKVVWQGDVTSDADIAAIVRSLHELKADGRFTDIGAALDSMDRLILDRNRPERPKYILLLTDERQEAPRGSAYYSADYVIKHPLLEYVKKVDKGSFRVITIGYGLEAKISGEAHSLMTTLSEPPDRPRTPLAGSEAGASSAGQQQAASGDASTQTGTDGGMTTAGDQATGDQAAGSAPGVSGDSGKGSPGGRTKNLFSGAPLTAGLAVAGAIAVLSVFFIARRRKRSEKKNDQPPAGHST